MCNEFVFSDNFSPPEGSFQAVLRDCLETKEDVLVKVAKALEFPGYYGVNWDAFEECINDLTWLNQKTIVLWHTEIPLPNDEASARIYFDILSKACGSLEKENRKRLIVVLPESRKKHVELLMT